MARTILHCDINNCFASIEMAMNPALRAFPIAVCGDPAQRRGIVLAKSESAKKCGVKTGDALWMAQKKCPNIRFVRPHFEIYEAYSRNIRAYYQRWTPLVEPYGLDECWLDVTGCPFLRDHSPRELADQIRADIKRIFRVTVSVGVSFNKIFAKLGSDLKKPDAVTEILESDFRQKIWALSVDQLFGVGRSTAERMKKLGIFTIGMLAETRPEFIHAQFGKNGDHLWIYANGLDQSPVCSWADPRQSIGHGATLPQDAWSTSEVWPQIYTLAERIAFELQEENFEAYGIQIYVRFSDLHFRQFQKQLDYGMNAARLIAEYALMMLSQSDVMRMGIRALGIRMFDLKNLSEPRQLSLFTQDKVRRNADEGKTDTVIRSIRSRFGESSIQRGVHEKMIAWCHPPGGAG